MINIAHVWLQRVAAVAEALGSPDDYEDYVEARANLGCLLAEHGQLDLAVAAFEGALRFHRDYPDAHYHLAKTLDELGQGESAEPHWRAFVALAPDNPWADEARARLDGDIDAAD